ncbi:HAD family hydrolase [Jeotgalibacillus marinus]|uniref:HAD family hydrolase n=1 Tax=Jeotgalibacillus marinus TaxID=86667 RepID=A0ABV3Q137_9BACL
MSYKGILLDLDDTLYNYEFAHKKGIDKAFRHASGILNKNRDDIEIMFLKAKESVKLELNESAASHNRMLYFQRMFENFNVNAQLHALETYELYWASFLKSMHFYNGAKEFLEFNQDIPICLVTDLTAHIQHRKLERLGVQTYINFMVSSEEAGKEKPHPYIFMSALNKLGLHAKDVIMIGDNLKKDIIGASSLGIKSFWLNHYQKETPNHFKHSETIVDFLQLKERLSYVY